MGVRVTTKYRAEWWVTGRKRVRIFGSYAQAWQWIRSNVSDGYNIDVRAFQVREDSWKSGSISG